jgi:hypothetical protein
MLQLCLANPSDAELLPAPRPPTDLLERIRIQPGDMVTICNLPLGPNRLQVWRNLETGAEVRLYGQCDTGEWILHPGLKVNIDASRGICASQRANKRLGALCRRLATVGNFGRGRRDLNDTYVAATPLTRMERMYLQALGELITYHAHIACQHYQHTEPTDLYAELVKYPDPLHFLRNESIALKLGAMQKEDLRNASTLPPFGKTTTPLTKHCPISQEAIRLRNASTLNLQRQHDVRRRRSSALKQMIRSRQPYKQWQSIDLQRAHGDEPLLEK